MASSAKVCFRVFRRNPGEEESRYDEFEVELSQRGMTVLDGLDQIKWYQDGSLTYRHACHHGVCGSCAMRVNGHVKLACNTKIRAQAEKYGRVQVDPMGNMPVYKDLIVDMDDFWRHDELVKPWLLPDAPPPERERLMSPEDRDRLYDVTNCIQCGACFSACEVLEVDEFFLGPAALALANRFVFDTRDAAANERLRELNAAHGIWDCTHCFECIEACPKDVKPMDAIMELRTETLKRDIVSNPGTRHIEAFSDNVVKTGWLNETTLAPRSIGWFNIIGLMRLIPLGVRMFLRGKMPSPIHRSIPGVKRVRLVAKKFFAQQKDSRRGH